ncbi:FAD-dependent oxidoreductase [Xanthobacter dioxanivorans]|uniref:FAD-dependent oxidoreductase n=1 Tax=Xanthobacter dioxanivorans TaxID=2528964 RepID=A0A974PNL1_9HYPH|nr:FAD-dependent oxidoreductase [Xanthobacter dioxanivorans]QRG06913.1 FAD-dependent oxidoreductase [Xanthobacter dioxanivorans]
MTAGRVIIVGAAHAGVQTAQTLRQEGWRGEVILFSGEAGFPYHRPPLSKGLLAGGEAAPVLLKPEGFYDKNGIELRRGTRVCGLDATARRIEAGGDAMGYDHLILATGAGPRRLAGTSAHNIVYLRAFEDALTLRSAISARRRLVIIGGGFIGLEVAAAAAAAGCDVNLVERAPRLLARSVPQEISDFIEARHIGAGVHIHKGVEAFEIEERDQRAIAVHLRGGGSLPCDIVLVGIGSEPDLSLAHMAGLETCLGGIRVDDRMRTSVAGISAVGDCTAFPSALASQYVRVESIQNAVDQGRAAALDLLGKGTPYGSVPWFWSHQFDLKLQMAGLPCDGRTLVRGEPGSGKFSVLTLQGDRIRAAYSINAPADHMATRQLIAEGALLDPEGAEDATTPLGACRRIAAPAA